MENITQEEIETALKQEISIITGKKPEELKTEQSLAWNGINSMGFVELLLSVSRLWNVNLLDAGIETADVASLSALAAGTPSLSDNASSTIMRAGAYISVTRLPFSVRHTPSGHRRAYPPSVSLSNALHTLARATPSASAISADRTLALFPARDSIAIMYVSNEEVISVEFEFAIANISLQF